LLKVVNQECAKKAGGSFLKFTADYSVTMGNGLGRKRMRRDEGAEEGGEEEEEVELSSYNASNMDYMANDVGLDNLPDVEVAEGEGDSGKSVVAGLPFTVEVTLKYHGKQQKNMNWQTQELSRQLMRDCVGSVLSHFESEIPADDNMDAAGITVASQYKAPEDMDSEMWPYWDRAGSGCAPGSILVGGSVQEPLECQACPRGTVYITKQKGLREICRPCPSGEYMADEGSTGNAAGEVGMCNACPSLAFMTNTFPAYSKETCVKTSCFPNRTKFQVVFALDSSGSVTRPDYIRMREFAKSIVNRMCINNSHDSGSKSCGQAAYVIYNQSAESYMKFKQVESQVDFNKIDNYEYRGGPARIGDLFEFIHDTYIDTTQLKNGLPLNVVLISDGQTQNDDKEQMEKWARILKKRVTKVITLSKRSQWNGNTLQLASSVDDRYFMNDYHELPGFVYPVMEKLCSSISEHKGRLARAKKLKLERRRAAKGTGK
jgi:hypothetical protein